MKLKRTLKAEKLLKIVTGAKFTLFIIVLATLFVGAASGEEEKSADHWYEKSLELYNNGSLEESLPAIGKAIGLDPKNATLWAHKASVLSMVGVITQNQSRFDESLRAYDKAIEMDPGNTTHLLRKGFAFRQAAYGLLGEERTRTLEEAVNIFDRALEIDPNYGEAWAGKGVIYDDLALFGNDTSRYNDSLAAYDKAIELAPANNTRNLALAYEGKAVALSHMGQDLGAKGLKNESRARLEEAVSCYDRVIELDKDFVGQEALQNRAGMLKELGRSEASSAGFDEAIASLNKSIEKSHNNSGAWVNIAFLLREQGRHEAAVEALNNATKIAPEYVLAWEVLGEVLSDDLGRYEEAIEAYDRALQLDPKEYRAWAGKGDALRSLGRNREAVQAYDNSLAIDPNRVTAWSGKGMALRSMGRYNESVQAYNEALRAIEQEPRYSSAFLAIAQAWFGKAEALVGPDRVKEAAEAYNESLKAYEKAIQIDPESAKAWMGKGDALLNLKRYNESAQAYESAIEVLNRSIEANPNDAKAWWLKAEDLEDLGRNEAALEAYDRVIDLNSSKVLGAWIRKSDLFISLGRYNESAEAFDGALNRLSTEDKQSIMTMWWARGTTVYHNAWRANGQILRVTSGWLNESSGDIENILLINSDLGAAWQTTNKGRPVSSDGKPRDSLQALGSNWAQYAFPEPKESAVGKAVEDGMQGPPGAGYQG